MNLETIKNTYAQEQGYDDWADLYHRAGYYDETEFFKHEDAVFILAQKAALEKAAENVTLISEHLSDNVTSFPKCVITNGINYSVYSGSITNPENLIR